MKTYKRVKKNKRRRKIEKINVDKIDTEINLSIFIEMFRY